jgi:hypothetical protein
MPAMPTDLDWGDLSLSISTDINIPRNAMCMSVGGQNKILYYNVNFGELLVGDLVESVKVQAKYNRDGLED